MFPFRAFPPRCYAIHAPIARGDFRIVSVNHGVALAPVTRRCKNMPVDGRSRPRMPFKSKAQRRKFAQLLVEGKISEETFEEWNRETGSKSLPERASTKKPAGKRKAVHGRKKKARSKS